MRYIRPVGDISISKRCFHRILHAECYARRFKRRNKLNCVLNASIYTISMKTVRYIGPVGDISPFHRYFHRILGAECYARQFLASKQAKMCAKCDHLHDFEENCALYVSCWRYFDVKTLFLLHFTRRMLHTPFSASRQAQLCAKCNHILDFDEYCALYPACWRYFYV